MYDFKRNLHPTPLPPPPPASIVRNGTSIHSLAGRVFRIDTYRYYNTYSLHYVPYTYTLFFLYLFLYEYVYARLLYRSEAPTDLYYTVQLEKIQDRKKKKKIKNCFYTCPNHEDRDAVPKVCREERVQSDRMYRQQCALFRHILYPKILRRVTIGTAVTTHACEITETRPNKPFVYKIKM